MQTKLSALNTKRSTEQGFTLIELLVVIVIIGVLAAIALPIFLNQQKAAKDAQLKSDVRSIAMAYTTWQTKNPNKEFPDVSYNWKNTEISVLENYDNWNVLNQLSLSEGTRIHAYDSFRRAGATETALGQGFCIEAGVEGGTFTGYRDTPGVRMFYSTAKGFKGC